MDETSEYRNTSVAETKFIDPEKFNDDLEEVKIVNCRVVMLRGFLGN
jgi:hypothetical protein